MSSKVAEPLDDLRIVHQIRKIQEPVLFYEILFDDWENVDKEKLEKGIQWLLLLYFVFVLVYRVVTGDQPGNVDFYTSVVAIGGFLYGMRLLLGRRDHLGSPEWLYTRNLFRSCRRLTTENQHFRTRERVSAADLQKRILEAGGMAVQHDRIIDRIQVRLKTRPLDLQTDPHGQRIRERMQVRAERILDLFRRLETEIGRSGEEAAPSEGGGDHVREITELKREFRELRTHLRDPRSSWQSLAQLLHRLDPDPGAESGAGGN